MSLLIDTRVGKVDAEKNDKHMHKMTVIIMQSTVKY